MSTKPKETGLICTGESVRAILDGRKTQTRRVMKIQPELPAHIKGKLGYDIQEDIWFLSPEPPLIPFDIPVILGKCPYGKVGGKLWVREKMSLWPGTVATGQEHL